MVPCRHTTRIAGGVSTAWLNSRVRSICFATDLSETGLVLWKHLCFLNTSLAETRTLKVRKVCPLLTHGLVSSLLYDVVPPCATANWTTVLKCVPPRATRSVTHGPYFRCFWFLKPYFLCFWFFKGPFFFSFLPSFV